MYRPARVPPSPCTAQRNVKNRVLQLAASFSGSQQVFGLEGEMHKVEKSSALSTRGKLRDRPQGASIQIHVPLNE